MSPNCLESSGKLSTVGSLFPLLSVIFGNNFILMEPPHAKFVALGVAKRTPSRVRASQLGCSTVAYIDVAWRFTAAPIAVI
jgi:hypothetical protein